jgi:class 3 adenylate cyclase
VHSGNVEDLEKDLGYEFRLRGFIPGFLCVRDPEGKVLTRRSPTHPCGRGCDHPVERWFLDREQALVAELVEIDGKPFAALGIAHEEGYLIVGLELSQDLDRLRDDFGVDLAWLSEGKPIYSSLSGWSPELGSQGDLRVGGTRYRAGALERGVLFWSLADRDRHRRTAFLVGGIGLLGALVSAAVTGTLLARGISKPVEALVEATRRVGEGDYGVAVDIASRDELGRLGRAFNEMTEGLRKRREIMEKTLSRDVAEELMKGVERGGERLEVTILFADVRGFTTATEGADPAGVVAALNGMMDLLAEAVHVHGGNVNKYLGDGLMAMFGAPRPLEGHALRAVRAGIEMQRRMEAWNSGRAAPLHVGVGIHTGVVLGGKVGSRDRLEYTLIGEAVNLASRLCGKAAPRQVLLTRDTFRQLGGGIEARELEPLTVKGLSYPVQVYEVKA